jgi:hypothetical protein
METGNQIRYEKTEVSTNSGAYYGMIRQGNRPGSWSHIRWSSSRRLDSVASHARQTSQFGGGEAAVLVGDRRQLTSCSSWRPCLASAARSGGSTTRRHSAFVHVGTVGLHRMPPRLGAPSAFLHTPPQLRHRRSGSQNHSESRTRSN